MDGTAIAMMDAVFDQALEADVTTEMNAAKKAGHVEQIEVPESADVESYCADLGLVVTPFMGEYATEMKLRDDDAPEEQEPIE